MTIGARGAPPGNTIAAGTGQRHGQRGRDGDTDTPGLGPLSAAHRSAVEQLLRSTEFFRDVEIDIALEVIDAHNARPGQDYHAVGAFTPGGDLLGYACWGPTPCTAGTWDLYWIAVHRSAQGRGLGTLLLQEVERRLARSDARLVLVETSSQPKYTPTHGFYRANGYAEVARVPDFYTEGDDKLVFAKRIHRSTGQAKP